MVGRQRRSFGGVLLMTGQATAQYHLGRALALDGLPARRAAPRRRTGPAIGQSRRRRRDFGRNICHFTTNADRAKDRKIRMECRTLWILLRLVGTAGSDVGTVWCMARSVGALP